MVCSNFMTQNQGQGHWKWYKMVARAVNGVYPSVTRSATKVQLNLKLGFLVADFGPETNVRQ